VHDGAIRLIREERSTPHAYDWSYEYDQAGNRTKKIDNLGDREWVYVYDTSAPGTYGSNNNRLMEVEEYDTSGNQPVLEFVSCYFYSLAGNVTRVVRHEEGTEEYTAHRLDDAVNGGGRAGYRGERSSLRRQDRSLTAAALLSQALVRPRRVVGVFSPEPQASALILTHKVMGSEDDSR
jgi:YD repeat-containing protein